jgi:hypothetical protein
MYFLYFPKNLQLKMIQLMSNLRNGFSKMFYNDFSIERIDNNINNIRQEINTHQTDNKQDESVINRLPTLVLEKIFNNLSDRDLLSCLLVCKNWNSLIENESESFWKNKCLIDKKLTKDQIGLLTSLNCNKKEFKMLYYSNLLNRNFLRNPSGHQFMRYWCCADSIDSRNFKDINKDRLKLIIETYKYNFTIPNCCHWSIEDSFEFENPSKLKSFTTLINKFGEKMQVIDLKMQSKIIDILINKNINLKLEIIEYYKVTSSSQYNLYVFLVNSDFQLIDNCNYYCNMGNGSNQNANNFVLNKWKIYRREFNIRNSVRYIIFYHSGESKSFGTKMTNGSIRFYV